MTLVVAAVVLIALMALLAVRQSPCARGAPDDEDVAPDEANPPHWWGAEPKRRRRS